ncbi:MAG: ATP-binding protein [Oscillospiraceae bacterium]|jgi:anti-sigma regulatory factor (Ser/Thr protein kinase)|nr:ATP-binding protein [Oscillospiraceae bacterium]
MENLTFTYTVPGDDFTRAGDASSKIKKNLRELGIPPAIIRAVAIAVYEGEINMVIHAKTGGDITVDVNEKQITTVLKDTGCGIPDLTLAMSEGWTTAPDEVRALGFGAGMGLPNMKKYADIFDITSEVGKGTTVTMKFNLA